MKWHSIRTVSQITGRKELNRKATPQGGHPFQKEASELYTYLSIYSTG